AAPSPRADIYLIPFHTYYLGVFDKRRRDWPEYKERFFRRGALEFFATVHANYTARSSNTFKLPADSPVFVQHLSCESVSDWIAKANRYTSYRDRASWFLNKIGVSRDFIRQQTDYWFNDPSYPVNEFPTAYAMLRVVYDMIDRLKRWEVEAGIDGANEFNKLCVKFQSEYDHLEESFGIRTDCVAKVRSDDVLSDGAQSEDKISAASGAPSRIGTGAEAMDREHARAAVRMSADLGDMGELMETANEFIDAAFAEMQQSESERTVLKAEITVPAKPVEEGFPSIAPFLRSVDSPAERREASRPFDARLAPLLSHADATLPQIHCFYE